jgi:hypothetical protein
MTARPIEQSLFPDHRPDRPVGPLPASVQRGTNADLIATIAPLYLTGSVLDVTYGEGGWWRRFQPAKFTAHDLYKLDGVDFRALPEPDRSVDAVCFDPPYVPQGGEGTVPGFRDAYGLQDLSVHWANALRLITDGLAECVRVSRRWVLVKCMEFVSSGEFHDFPYYISAAADDFDARLTITHTARQLGCRTHDVIVHHTGSGPGGHNIWEPIRARRHHSYLIVFEVPA